MKVKMSVAASLTALKQRNAAKKLYPVAKRNHLILELRYSRESREAYVV